MPLEKQFNADGERIGSYEDLVLLNSKGRPGELAGPP